VTYLCHAGHVTEHWHPAQGPLDACPRQLATLKYGARATAPCNRALVPLTDDVRSQLRQLGWKEP
jgi:hypothetical protein